MKIQAWMKKEQSGLAVTTLELCKATADAGHDVSIRLPGEDAPLWGPALTDPDLHTVHSQLGLGAYYDGKPKFLWCHGEPLSSVGNGVSMKAIVDLAPQMDAFIAMRKDEVPIWSAIKRTYLVTKGIDLNRYKPIPLSDRLSGEPAILYYENWRGQRNPLYWCVAMQEVWKKLPKARLHLYNCRDTKMQATFKALVDHAKWWPFLRSIQGAAPDVNALLNKADIIVSGLYPLYARGIEAFGAGKAFISPGYREHDYPWTCEYSPASMAQAILSCWENYGQVNYRQWAEDHHDVRVTAAEAIEIYQRYL